MNLPWWLSREKEKGNRLFAITCDVTSVDDSNRRAIYVNSPGPNPATTDNYVDRSHGDVDLLRRGESSTSVDNHEGKRWLSSSNLISFPFATQLVLVPPVLPVHRLIGITRHGHAPLQRTFLPRAIQFSAPLTAGMQYGTADWHRRDGFDSATGEFRMGRGLG